MRNTSMILTLKAPDPSVRFYMFVQKKIYTSFWI